MVAMSETPNAGLDRLKGAKLDEGLFCVGEYRGYEDRESGGKIYYKLKCLVRDITKKFDIKAEDIIKLNGLEKGKQVIIQYYEFTGKFGVNYVCNGVSVL
jgi:hypothetical protein